MGMEKNKRALFTELMREIDDTQEAINEAMSNGYYGQADRLKVKLHKLQQEFVEGTS